jgi:hypothetical protein
MLITKIFLGPSGEYDYYHRWEISKLNNNIIDEKINEGFSQSRCLFGGMQYKKKYFKYKQKYLKYKNYSV